MHQKRWFDCGLLDESAPGRLQGRDSMVATGIALLALGLLTCFEPPAHGNLLTNAGFENGAFAGWTTSGSASIITNDVRSGVREAQQRGLYFKLVISEKQEFLLNKLSPLGLPDPHGNHFNRGAGSPTRRWHEYYWRHLSARYGAFRSVHSWELVNEEASGPARGEHVRAGKQERRRIGLVQESPRLDVVRKDNQRSGVEGAMNIKNTFAPAPASGGRAGARRGLAIPCL